MSNLFRYPLYVISKGRADKCLTADFLVKDNVEFSLVVEPQEFDLYQQRYGKRVVKLPFSNLGLGSYPARNWCWENSMELGYDRHWILDDNIRSTTRMYKGLRIKANSHHAFKFVEDLTENYTNIAISGMNYEMFVTNKTKQSVVVNHHIYSNLLIKNDIPHRWRLRYNEDTDLNIQVLKAGYCTLYTNVFLIQKMQTMTMKGGNTNELYQDNGRLKMARMLEKTHPDIVTVKWRFGRPQHVVKWDVFKQPLIKSENYTKLDLKDYGTLTEVNPVKSKALKDLIR